MSKKIVKEKIKILQEKLELLEDSDEIDAIKDQILLLEEEMESPIWKKIVKGIAIAGAIAGLASTVLGMILAVL